MRSYQALLQNTEQRLLMTSLMSECLSLMLCRVTFKRTRYTVRQTWETIYIFSHTALRLGFVYTVISESSCLLYKKIQFCWDSLWEHFVFEGADKSLALPGRKQATMKQLGTYSTYSPRRLIHFVVRCSNNSSNSNISGFCPSNQVSAAAKTSALDEKWQSFYCLFRQGNK